LTFVITLVELNTCSGWPMLTSLPSKIVIAVPG
jgi:hypothetical protein